MASIEKHIKDLSARWINPTYASEVMAPTQIQHLIVHAFVNKVPEGPETKLLREAYKRLQNSSLGSEYLP